MQKLFVGYEQAQKLRSLGFDEECLARYCVVTEWEKPTGEVRLQISSDCPNNHKTLFKAPLYQQAFDWLCKRINLSTTSWSLEFTESGWDLIHVDKATYEIIDIFRNEAALNKLIKIVENEKSN